MRDYELTLVVRPDVEDTGLAALLEKIKGLITTAGAQGIQVEPWGRRHLAYPIKKITEAQYFLIRAQLPAGPPAGPEPLETILADYRGLIEPNITHWQHPGFMAYFASTASGPGILGEWLAASLNSNVMLWRNAPASTELEASATPAPEAAPTLDVPAIREVVDADTFFKQVKELVRERAGCLACEYGFLLDGFPRTIEQAHALEGILAGVDRRLDAALRQQALERRKWN